METLNSNSDLLSCTQNLVQATANYGPGGNTSSSTSSTALSNSLSSICSSSTACDEAKIRTALSSFYSSCSSELTSNKNQDVQRAYDFLYTLIPMREAVCSKDDSGKWCATQVHSSSAGVSVSASVALANNAVDTGNQLNADDIQANLWVSSQSKRADAIYPNVTTFASNNLPFLGIQAGGSYAELCTTCTRNVLTAYIDFESSTPYAPGLSNSLLLGGQTQLYNGVQSTCGSSFLSGAVQAAGSLSDGSSDNNGSFKTLRFDFQSMIATILGVATMSAFAFFWLHSGF